MSPPATPPHTAPRPTRAVLHVGDLPSVVFGPRNSFWWGTMCFVVIESMTLGAVAASHLYVARNFDDWPPPPYLRPELGYGLLSLALLLGALWPQSRLSRAAERLDRAATLRWLWVVSALGVAATVARVLELADGLHVRWDANAYGSTTWALVVGHATLLVVDVAETAVLTLVFALGREEPKHFPDVTDDAAYSVFTSLSYVAVFALVYLMPRWR